jgi:uncharacterized protein
MNFAKWLFRLVFAPGSAKQRFRDQQGEADRKFLANLQARADKGDTQAQFDLGYAYSHGQGVAKDEAEAVKWYRKAAEQNHAYAQYKMGLSYYQGIGVAKDYEAAVKWYRKAAELNLPVAQFTLGVCCAVGQGVAQERHRP